MKKRILLTLLIFVSLFSYAQKVDLDRYYARVNYIELPSTPILDETKRTFSFSSNDPLAESEVVLYGFERVEKDGDVDVSLYFDRAVSQGVEVNTIEHEDKDKEGNVTKRWNTYEAVIKYSISGRVTYKTPNSDQIKKYDIKDKNVTTKSFKVYRDASNYARNNAIILRERFELEFAKKQTKQLVNYINRRFGYREVQANELFWILDSEKNPEYEAHKKAWEDIKVIFSKISADTDVKALEPEVKKIEDYFNSVIPKFPKKKRRHRKMRYASYYNIAKLYYTIENLDKAKEYAQKVIDNRYDKSDGKRIIKSVDNLLEEFKINKVNTRHFKVETKR